MMVRQVGFLIQFLWWFVILVKAHAIRFLLG